MKYTLSTVTVLIIFLCAWIQSPCAWATVSGHLKIKVTTGGPNVDLFTFDAPAACSPMPCTDDRVIVAKFVVTDPPAHYDLSFELRSVTSGTDKYPVRDFSTAGGGPAKDLIDGDTGTPAASVYARFTGESAYTNYRVVKIQVRIPNNYDSFPPGEQWKIQAVPSAGDDYYYGFWADGLGESAIEALVTKPYLIDHIEDSDLNDFTLFSPFSSLTNIQFGDVHINLDDMYLPEEMYGFRNVGTQTLNITGVTPSNISGSAYDIVGYPSPPLPVLPMAPFLKRITCQPTSTGAIADVLIDMQTDSTDVGTIELNLTNSRGIVLKASVLLDLSGSMTSIVDGQQKIYWARLAAREFSELFEQILPDAELSLYSYPNRGGTCPSSEEHIGLNEISNNIQGFENHLDPGLGHPDLLVRTNSLIKTPLAEGIKSVYNLLSGGGQFVRKAVLLFGDGEHNCDSSPPRPEPEDWYNWTQFQNAGIPFYTIPYGQTDASWITTFNLLATNSGGDPYPADITDTTELQKNFKKILGDILDLEPLKDPAAHVNAGANKEHDVCVTESTYQLVFSVHWEAQDSNALTVKVETPYHVFITPATASSSDDVGYVSGDNYVGYVVRGDYLKGSNGSGLWKLHVKGNTSTDYVYQVLAKDRMETEASFDLLFVGEIANLTFNIKNGDYRVKNANVTAQYSMPTASFTNYLAGTYIDPKLVLKVPEVLCGQPATLAERKHFALTYYADKPFQAERSTGVLNVSQPGAGKGAKIQYGNQDLVYTSSFNQANYTGLYDIVWKVEGLTAKEECFQREYTISRYADIKLSSELMGDAVFWDDAQATPYFDAKLQDVLLEPPPDDYIRKNIVFTPKDQFGNYFGVGRASEIDFKLNGAEQIGPVTDNLDGSYIMTVQYRKGTEPGVIVSAQGVSSPEVKVDGPPSHPPDIDMGIKVGFNFANLSASGSTTPEFDWANKTGFCAGAYLSFKLSKYLAFQPEVLVSRKGLKVDQVTTTNTFNIDFLEIPLLIKLTLSPGSSISPCLHAGPFAAIKLNDNVITGAGVPPISKFDYGITFGGGFDVKLGGNILTLETRYTMGLKNISEDASMTVKSKVLSFIIGLEL
jgi:hypothetical protein